MEYTHSTNENGWQVTSWGEGSLIYSGCEIHMEGYGYTRKRVKELLGPIFDEFGFLTTRMEPDEDTSFIERMGFKPTWSDGFFRYYMLTELRSRGHGKGS